MLSSALAVSLSNVVCFLVDSSSLSKFLMRSSVPEHLRKGRRSSGEPRRGRSERSEVTITVQRVARAKGCEQSLLVNLILAMVMLKKVKEEL